MKVCIVTNTRCKHTIGLLLGNPAGLILKLRVLRFSFSRLCVLWCSKDKLLQRLGAERQKYGRRRRHERCRQGHGERCSAINSKAQLVASLPLFLQYEKLIIAPQKDSKGLCSL